MEDFDKWWNSHCYGNDRGGVVYKHCKEAWEAARFEPVRRLKEINNIIFAAGAPLGTYNYFEIRGLATLPQQLPYSEWGEE